MKRAVGHAGMQGHLAALKSAAARIAAPGFLSLVAGTGSLAEFGAYTPAHAHFAVTRADRRTKIREARKSERPRSPFAGRFAAAAGFSPPLSAFLNFFCHFPISPPSP